MLDGEVGLLPGQLAGDAHLFQPRLVRAPAEVVHVVGGRADDVVFVAEEVDAAVAVVVDGMIEIAGRQELRLADLARPRADHLGRLQVPAVDDLQGGLELLLEHHADGGSRRRA